MKNYLPLFTAIASVFSVSGLAQGNDIALLNTKTKNAPAKFQNIPDKDLVVESYLVEERVNMAFGTRITTYKVSKLNMVNRYDLGPNNTRTVTPAVCKTKRKCNSSYYGAKKYC